MVTATGGFPDSGFLSSGEEFVVSTWDVLSGNAAVSGSVLIYDDHGGEHAPSVAEYLSGRGVTNIELVTPDRLVAQDLAATTGPVYLEMLYSNGVAMTPDHQLVRVELDGAKRRATLRNVFTREEFTRTVDVVVFEHGVEPNDELYTGLIDASSNRGVIDIAALMSGTAQPAAANGYALYRVGDAVASRSIAAAIYDARRLCRLL